MKNKIPLNKMLEEELDSDLAECLSEDNPGFVDHQLIRDRVNNREEAVKLNALYQSKLLRLEQAYKESDWGGYVFEHVRPYRIDIFKDIERKLNDQYYWELLAEVWIDCENIWQNKDEWRDLWNNGRPQKQFAMVPEERETLERLPNELRIYRGIRDADNIDGLSWTLSREKAIWFARRFRGNFLLTARANKVDVHAFLDRRKEQEIIVDRYAIISREQLPDAAERPC
jgi:hypothetical protein